MTRIPHSAAEHLRRMAPAGDHPDANLLSAFAEGALSVAERGQLTQHLAACAECRETLALALPEQPEVLPAGHEVGAWWLRWPFLRWAGLAASMAVVAGVLVMQIARQSGERLAGFTNAPEAAAPAPTTRTAQPESAKAQADLKAAEERAPAREKSLEKEAALGDSAALASPKPQSRTLATAGGSLVTSPQAEPVAPPPPPPFSKPDAPARTAEPAQLANAREQKKDQAFMRDPIVPSPPVERDDIRPATTHDFAYGGRLENKHRSGYFVSESKVESPAAGKEVAKDTPAESADAVGGVVPLQPGAVGEMARANEEQKIGLAKSRSGPSSSTRPAGFMGLAAAVESRWRLVNGELQRSFDEGRNWEGVPIADEVAPLAVDARAPVVWVAGNKRDLYYSSDNGLRWQRVSLPHALTGNVRELKARDLLRVDLGTSTGERWSTEDGGKTWIKK